MKEIYNAMKIISLVENTSRKDGMEAEHGLSLYIETKDHKILFDMGQTNLFEKNARKLNIDLSNVDIAILSHGHYDHGGGLARFLEINAHAPVYINKHAFEPHFNGKDKYIGLDPSLQSSPRIIFTDGNISLSPKLHILTLSPDECHHPIDSAGLFLKKEEAFIPDDFRHEQYLLIKEDNKHILISGCSHKGILNVVSFFAPDVLIGGFHLSKHPLDNELDKCARELERIGSVYYTCHCTGKAQFEFMGERMSSLHYLSSGECIDL